ncbi:MAG TPA: two-component regulator propeller domain-containing protein [Bryobacteraceae bacterium]
MGSAQKLRSIYVLLAAASCNLLALDPSLELSQFSHSSWLYSSGFISGTISSIDQTNDGYLWLGTNAGLYRYDGVRFQPYTSPGDHEPVNMSVRSLMSARDGSLWIGTASGILRISNSRSAPQPVLPRQIPAGAVTDLLEDSRGVVWASQKSTLIRISGDQVQFYSKAQGLPPQITANLFEDSRHRLWLGGATGPCQVNVTGIHCFGTGAVKPATISELPDHRLILSDSTSGALLAFDGEHLAPITRETAPALPRTMLTDSKGVTWFASVGRGLARLRGTTIDTFGRRQGLTGDLIAALFMDREGDLWTATSGGLDRFRDFPLPRRTVFEGLSGDVVTTVAPSSDGAMWVGTAGAGVDRILGQSTTVYDQKSGFPRPTIESLLEDSSHREWVATTGGLMRGENGHFTPVKDNQGHVLPRVLSLAESGGAVWILNDLSELFRAADGQVVPVALDASVTRDKDLYQMVPAADGSLWLGHYRGGLTRLSGGLSTTISIPDSKPGTAVNALCMSSRDGSLWVATADGLHRLHGRHWSFYRRNLWRDEPVLGVVEDARGIVWIATSNVLVRLTFAKPDQDPTVEIIGGGLHLGDQGRTGGPKMALSRSGEIWIATDEGVVIVDPKHSPADVKPLVPPAIETVSVDGHALALPASGEAKFQGHEVGFEYTLPEMGQPEAIRFRYKMEGFQQNWLDAGTRRQTAYANMGPGHYHFCVTAALPGQEWDGPETCQALEVLPYFYQTWWFMIAIMIGLLALVAGAYQVRMRQLRGRFQLVMRERMRVARELHDTLLQGFAGITYKLEVVSRQMIAAPEPSQKNLDAAIVEAEASLLEARNAIQFLRLEALEHGEIFKALESACRGLAENSGASVKVVVEDGVRDLSPEIKGTLYMIAREAVRNAVGHGHARHIAVTVSRRNGGGPTLTVEDDGQGFDTEEGFAKENHYGMVGMSERAKEIGAVFNVTSAPGQGTRIEVRFPRTKL